MLFTHLLAAHSRSHILTHVVTDIYNYTNSLREQIGVCTYNFTHTHTLG